MMTEAKSIAKELGNLPQDEQCLQAEISRLNRNSIVPLEHLKELHLWLDEKRKARQSCRIVGESRTGKTIACESYTLRNELPCHKIESQFKSVWRCAKHGLKLLSKCPNCGKKFKIPAFWEFGECDRCRLSFGEMAAYQKSS